MLSLGATVKASRDQVSCELGQDAAILHLGSGVYYTLNPVGARVWAIVQQPVALRQLRETLLAEYDVTPDRLDQDLGSLLDDLLSQGLIEILHTPSS